jgi:uncharacterized protein
MYEQGLSVAPDKAEAVRWYQLAAKQGDPIGEFLLASSLAEGRGIAKDWARAIELPPIEAIRPPRSSSRFY